MALSHGFDTPAIETMTESILAAELGRT